MAKKIGFVIENSSMNEVPFINAMRTTRFLDRENWLPMSSAELIL